MKRVKEPTDQELDEMLESDIAIQMTLHCGACQNKAVGNDEVREKFIFRDSLYADDMTPLTGGILIECRECHNKFDLIIGDDRQRLNTTNKKGKGNKR